MKYRPGSTDKCPHCKVVVRFELCSLTNQGSSNIGQHGSLRVRAINGHSFTDFYVSSCPACTRQIIFVENCFVNSHQLGATMLAYPQHSERTAPQAVIDDDSRLAEDFKEAAAVLIISKKASAVLSRRCLQHILITKGECKTRDLGKQIEEILSRLPSSLAQNVDAIRNVGNFAAHPIKSTNPNEIVDVEDHEAEWLLDVLEELMDHFYVAPKLATIKRNTLNAKLQSAGKPPLRST